MKKAIMPYLARVLASDNLLSLKRHVHHLKQSLHGQQRNIDVFLKVDDPYSYLLVQVLETFTARYEVKLTFHVFIDQDASMFPRLAMWRAHAIKDAAHLAKLYHLNEPSSEPNIELSIKPISDRAETPDSKATQQEVTAVAQALVHIESSEHFLTQASTLLAALWQAKPASDQINKGQLNTDQLNKVLEQFTPLSVNQLAQANQKLTDNYALLTRKGHYLGAMLNFQGEWYWGIDRLDHLETRLIKLGYCNSLTKNAGNKKSDNNKAGNQKEISREAVYFDKTYRAFCQSDTSALTFPASNCAIEFYWSARSPYSYIALERITQLAEHYKLNLKIKPVLPMMMRGLTVPEVKKMYIFHDTKREAKKTGAGLRLCCRSTWRCGRALLCTARVCKRRK